MLEVKVEGLDEVRVQLEGMIVRTSNLAPALLRAGVVPLDAGKERIEVGGPGWPPNKTGTPLLRKTGRLFNSLTVNAGYNVFDTTSDSVTVGTNVSYARYLQEGTSSHARGTPMVTKQGPRAREHHGIPAREFLGMNAKIAESVRAIFEEHVMGISGAH